MLLARYKLYGRTQEAQLCFRAIRAYSLTSLQTENVPEPASGPVCAIQIARCAFLVKVPDHELR
jgi:hypothetical protein